MEDPFFKGNNSAGKGHPHLTLTRQIVNPARHAHPARPRKAAKKVCIHIHIGACCKPLGGPSALYLCTHFPIVKE